MSELIVIIILSGLLVWREVSSYIERKRLTGMIFSKSVGDLKYLEEDEPKRIGPRPNPILNQHARQNDEVE